MEACPDAICEEAHGGFFPLHNTYEGGCTDDVIQYLIECWPQAVQMLTDMRMLLLHHACRGNSSLNVIQVLVQEWSDAIHL